MQLTTRELVSATLARELPSKSISAISSIVKRIHASAAIIRDQPLPDNEIEQPIKLASKRATEMLKGTGWKFDASNTKAPAIVKGNRKIVLH